MATIFRPPLFTRHRPLDYTASRSPLAERNYVLTLLNRDTQFAGPGQWKVYDWPNPILPKDRIANRTFLHSLPLNLLGKDSQFLGPGRFRSYDYPNPIPPATRIANYTHLSALPLNLLGRDKFYGAPGQTPPYDYPNPTRVPLRVANLTHLWPLQLNLLGLDALPVRNTDWPVPRPLRPVPTFSSYNQALLTAPAATGTTIFRPPLITRIRPIDRSASVNAGPGPNLVLTLYATVQAPFSGIDWTTPRRRPPQIANLTYLEVPLVGQDFFYGAPSQVPTHVFQTPRGYPVPAANRTHFSPPLIGQDAIFGAPGQVPAYSWPNPIRPPSVAYQAFSAYNHALLSAAAAAPFVNTDFQTPRSTWRPIPEVGAYNLALHTAATPPVQVIVALPPAGPVQWNRGFVQALPLQLLGQDRFYGAPGEVQSVVWPTPPPPRQTQFDLGPPSYALANTPPPPAPPFVNVLWPNPFGYAFPVANRTFFDSPRCYLLAFWQRVPPDSETWTAQASTTAWSNVTPDTETWVAASSTTAWTSTTPDAETWTPIDPAIDDPC